MSKLYLAAPLFSDAELSFNVFVSDVLSTRFEVYLPQRDGDLLVNLVAKGMSPERAREKIFKQDIKAIEESDYLLIVLDGRAIDEGACFELGFAFSKSVKCFGLQTDSRKVISGKNNPMIDEALIRTFNSVSELEDWVNGNNVIKVS